MWNEAEEICLRAIDSCLPEEGVKEALKQISPEADLILVAVGKAAFSPSYPWLLFCLSVVILPWQPTFYIPILACQRKPQRRWQD